MNQIVGEDDPIDLDVFVQELGLDTLLDRYTTGKFLPVPEGIPIINLQT